MSGFRAFLRGRGGDALILALLVGAELEVWTTERAGWTAALFAPLWTLPLLLRRRSGLAPGLLMAGVLAVEGFVFYPGTESSAAFFSIITAFLIAGLHEPRRRAIVGGAVGYVLVFLLASNDPTFTTSDAVIVGIFVVGPLMAGMAIRERTQLTDALAEKTRQLAEMHEEAARIAVAEERARIAGELHDVIARAIDKMAAQAEAAQAVVLEDPERARGPIEAVEEAGRDALAETRRLLGVLRRDMSEATT